MAKKNKNRGSTQKTQDKKEIRKDSKEKIKKKPIDDMEHKIGIQITKLHEHPFNRVLQSLVNSIKSIRALMINLIIIILCLFLILIVYRELNRDFIVIEPFNVPKRLNEQGYTGRAITNKLIDRFNSIRLNLKDMVGEVRDSPLEDMKIIPFESLKELEIELPGTGISLNSVLNNIRRLFGREPTRIIGEIVERDTRMFMQIRVSGKPPSEDIPVVDLENLDEVLMQAAEYIYKYTRPFILMSYFLFNEEYEACIEINKHLIYLHDDDESAYATWGTCLAAQGDYDGAIVPFQKAVELDPKSYHAQCGLGTVFALKGDNDSAIILLQKAIELDPRPYGAYMGLALVLGRQGDYDGAITMYKKVIELNPSARTVKDARDLIKSIKEKTKKK